MAYNLACALCQHSGGDCPPVISVEASGRLATGSPRSCGAIAPFVGGQTVTGIGSGSAEEEGLVSTPERLNEEDLLMQTMRTDRRDRGRSRCLASISLTIVAALLFNGIARAATVNALQGQVLVSAGQGFRLVNGSTQLEPGAAVVANPGAVAQVVYSGSCMVTVRPGSVYRIAPQAPCQTGEPTQSGGLTDTGGSSGGSGTTWLIAGGALVAGGAAAYFLLPPLSP